MIDKTNPQVLRELARDASELLDDGAFSKAVRNLHDQWISELLDEAKDDEAVRMLRAKLIALDGLVRHLVGMARVVRGQDAKRFG